MPTSPLSFVVSRVCVVRRVCVVAPVLASALLPGCYAGVPDPPEQRPALDGGLPLALDQPPLYARWGDIPVAVLGFVLALAAWLVGGGRRRAG